MSRLETMVMMAGMELPSRAIREQSTSALDFIIHVRRFEDGTRRVDRVSELVGLEQDVPQLQDIFVFERRQQVGRSVEGEFRSTGIVPRVIEELRNRGVTVPVQDLFGKATV